MPTLADLRRNIIKAPLASPELLDAIEELCDAEDAGELPFCEVEDILDRRENQDG